MFVLFFYIYFINLSYFIYIKNFSQLLKQVYISFYTNNFRIKLFRNSYYRYFKKKDKKQTKHLKTIKKKIFCLFK